MLKEDKTADNRPLIFGVELNDVWQDLLYESISNWKVIGSGLCGVVCHASIRRHDYAVKKCSLAKSDESVLDELENESKILQRLKEIKEVSNFVPSIHYYGNIWLQQLLVCDFINGHVYESLDEMEHKTKLACLERVKQLHASNILHGDLRAANFVVQFQPEIKVFIIDFGRSKILDKNAETHEKEEFEESLVEEMNDFKSELKLN